MMFLWSSHLVNEMHNSSFALTYASPPYSCPLSHNIMVCLEVKKRRGSRVEGRRVIQLPCLKVF